LVVGERMYRICEGSLVSEDTNFVHTIKVLSVWSSNASNHKDSVLFINISYEAFVTMNWM